MGAWFEGVHRGAQTWLSPDEPPTVPRSGVLDRATHSTRIDTSSTNPPDIDHSTRFLRTAVPRELMTLHFNGARHDGAS